MYNFENTIQRIALIFKKKKEGTYYSSYWNKRMLKRVFDCWWCFYNSPTIFVYSVLNSLLHKNHFTQNTLVIQVHGLLQCTYSFQEMGPRFKGIQNVDSETGPQKQLVKENYGCIIRYNEEQILVINVNLKWSQRNKTQYSISSYIFFFIEFKSKSL